LGSAGFRSAIEIHDGVELTARSNPSRYRGFDPNNLTGATLSMGGLQLVGVSEIRFTLTGNYSVSLGIFTGNLGAVPACRGHLRGLRLDRLSSRTDSFELPPCESKLKNLVGSDTALYYVALQ
jgi:hypothetical protein